MKFSMIRESLDRVREQISDKRNDQRIIHEPHVDYVFLTNIPSSVDFDGIDEAFDCFALKICKTINEKITDITSTYSYFSYVHLHLAASGFWTFRFRFDNFRLDDEYEIDTESA